jgi:hypothetical protein
MIKELLEFIGKGFSRRFGHHPQYVRAFRHRQVAAEWLEVPVKILGNHLRKSIARMIPAPNQPTNSAINRT